jgi:riboflavin synthase
LTIQGEIIFDDLKLGDSVAVNGVCLTVSSIQKNVFLADVMSETLNRSSLSQLKSGSSVNLERAMAANGRFGGHIVSGHIDGTGTISAIQKEDNAVWLTINTTEKVMKYIVEKGSITIDGISLTIAKVQDNSFRISIIPHTAKSTILNSKGVGDIVNLENDIVGKYIEQFLSYTQKECEPKSNITAEFLAKAGF